MPLLYADDSLQEIEGETYVQETSNDDALESDLANQESSDESSDERPDESDFGAMQSLRSDGIPEIPIEELGSEENYESGEIIVVFSDDDQIENQIETLTGELDNYAQASLELESQNGFRTLSTNQTTAEEIGEGIPSDPTALVEIPDELTVAQALAIAEETPGVISAYPNYKLYLNDSEIYPLRESNDNYLSEQWSLYKTNVLEAWDNPYVSGMSTIMTDGTPTVAVFDTGVFLTHPDLMPNLDTSHAWDLAQTNDKPLEGDIETHGTMVAGIVSAVTDNGIGVAGAADNRVRVMPIKVMYIGSDNKTTGSTADIIEAIELVLEHKQSGVNIQVINMSIGGYFLSDDKKTVLDLSYEEAIAKNAPLYNAVVAADQAGILIVAAAGNEGSKSAYKSSTTGANCFSFPSDYNEVLSVTSTTASDTRASTSSYNQYKDLAAPGVNITSTSTSESGYNRLSSGGTSYAAPLVASVAALLFGVDNTLTNDEVKQILYDSAKDLGVQDENGRNDEFGHGLLDAQAAVETVVAQLEGVHLNDVVVEPIENQVYTGSAVVPDLELKHESISLRESIDYTVVYYDNNSPGTATAVVTGTGDYVGIKTIQFDIKADFTQVTTSNVNYQIYTGSPITPNLDVFFGDKKLILGEDFTMSYSNNTNRGQATIELQGKGCYSGTKTVNFDIRVMLSDTTIAPVETQDFNTGPLTPKMYIAFDSYTLLEGTDYRVEYSNNVNPGTATAKVIGLGDFVGEESIGFTIDGSLQKYLAKSYDNKVVTIGTRLGANQVIDVPNASTDSWVYLNTWTANNTSAQRYRVVAQKNAEGDFTGYISFINVKSNKAFDVSGGLAVAGAGIHQYNANGSDAQLFSLVESNETGYFYLVSKINGNYAIDIAGGSAANGSRVQLWTCNNSNGQKFRLDIIERPSALTDGIYTFTSVSSGHNLDAVGSESTKGTNIYQAATSALNSQRFNVIYDELSGYFEIVSLSSGLSLDIPGASTARGANVQLWNRNNSMAQRWRAVPVEGKVDTFVFYNVNSSLVLDVSGGSVASGANVDIWSYNGSAAQQWKLTEGSALSHEFDASLAESLDNRVITINTTFAPNGTTQVIDVPNATVDSWVNLNTWNANNTSAQRYRVVAQKVEGLYTGYFSLINVKSGKAFDVQGGVAIKGAGVHQYNVNGTAAQLFGAVSTGDSDGSVYLISAINPDFCLDIAGGNPQNGSKVQIWTWNKSQAQKFILVEITPVLEDGIYRIKNQKSGRYLEVSNVARGANVQQGPQSASTGSQRFTISFDVSNGYYLIANGDYVVDVTGGSKDKGANVQLWSFNGSMAQYYFPVEVADNTYIFRNVNSSLVLDVAGGYTTQGANVQQWSNNGSAAQSWILETVE